MTNSNTPIPRQDYPRPLLVRDQWLCLNGPWGFGFDPDNIGLRAAWYDQNQTSNSPKDQVFNQTIIVPFCVESAASTIQASGKTSSNPANILWYKRSVEIPDQWLADRLMLRIGASDHWTRVFVNGLEVGQNRGGYAPFAFDIAHAAKAGANTIVIRVEDSASWSHPRGKQDGTMRWPIDYDSVTGIWQSVWLEPLSSVAIENTHIEYCASNKTAEVTVEFSSMFTGTVKVSLQDSNLVIHEVIRDVKDRMHAKLNLDVTNTKEWSPASPTLYQLKLELRDDNGDILDQAESYTGLREITTGAQGIKINGEPLYIRGVLDQGYFQEGWYTPVDDEAIKKDIELTLAMGFNCVRKHQKAEDPRYLYWADRLGLLVWAEMPSGRIFSTELITTLTDEWLRLILRDRAHPSVIAWVPFNESWGVMDQTNKPAQRSFVDGIYHLTRSLDTTRPVVANDGWEFSSGDLWTLHIYEGDGKTVAERLKNVLADPQAKLYSGGRVGALPGANVSQLPVLLTEGGGIGFIPEGYQGETFAYGDIPQNLQEFEKRVRAGARDFATAGKLSGFVWTQLTDIQQEINGLLTFDRQPKLPIETLHEIFSGIGKE